MEMAYKMLRTTIPASFMSRFIVHHLAPPLVRRAKMLSSIPAQVVTRKSEVVQVRLRCGNPQLAQVLHSLESGAPRLFVDNLNLIAQRFQQWAGALQQRPALEHAPAAVGEAQPELEVARGFDVHELDHAVPCMSRAGSHGVAVGSLRRYRVSGLKSCPPGHST